MQSNLVLSFTRETSVNNTIPLLDIKVEVENNEYKTNVYRKPTNLGNCMNAQSECPDRYKSAVIRAFIHRALKICTTDLDMKKEFKFCRQMLVNNGFSNREFDKRLVKIQGNIEQSSLNIRCQ